MLDNCNYNAIKILHELSSLAWFLQKHAIQDEKKDQHSQYLVMYEQLLKDLDKHINAMKNIVE